MNRPAASTSNSVPNSSGPSEEVRISRFCEACGKYDPNGTQVQLRVKGRYDRLFSGIPSGWTWDQEKERFVRPKGKKGRLYRPLRGVPRVADSSDSD